MLTVESLEHTGAQWKKSQSIHSLDERAAGVTEDERGRVLHVSDRGCEEGAGRALWGLVFTREREGHTETGL